MKKWAILLFCFCACNGKQDEKFAERSNNLKNYYQAILKSEFPKNEIVLIFQNQRCSSCRVDIFKKLSDYLNESALNKTFIMARSDSSLTNEIADKNKVKIFIDTNGELKNYGLDYAADLFFLIENGRLKNYFEISNVNIDSLQSLN